MQVDNCQTVLTCSVCMCAQVWYPLLRLREAGHETFTVGPEQGKSYTSKHGYPCKADFSIDQVSTEVVTFDVNE